MMASWVDISGDSDFSLANIPFAVFSTQSSPRPRGCTRVGATVIDLSLLTEAGLFSSIHEFNPRVFQNQTLNAFMAYDKPTWKRVRDRIIDLLKVGGSDELQNDTILQQVAFHKADQVRMHLPASIGDYTDFYSSREHATNVGTMFRGKQSALQPNWLHLPVGYHGRSSSVFVSGTPITRPSGQLQKDNEDPKEGSVLGPCKLLDFELEVAAFVGGTPNKAGTRLTIQQAKDRIFGFCLMNDWSARDIQKWEYVPLGPFTAKNFATSISPWIVTTMALDLYSSPTSAGEQKDPMPLDYLRDPEYSSFDISLEVAIQGETMEKPETVCRSNFCNLYWNAAQQLVHHSVTGCVMRPGDLLGSGTISGSTEGSFGSMLELSWKGTRNVPLGETRLNRKFLQDGDVVVMKGFSDKPGLGRIGFGECRGKILPAVVSVSHIEKVVTTGAKTKTKERYSDFKLYSFWRSSASWRVRIALNAKGICYVLVPVNLSNSENKRANFTERNPMAQVPTLECCDVESGEVVQISQSVAIMEFLEEAFPSRPALYPLDISDRAAAREMVELINSGIQPLQNRSLIRDLESRSGGAISDTFAADRICVGLTALEKLVKQRQDRTGNARFCLGGFGPTVVDFCTIPQLTNARTTYKIDVDRLFPTLARTEEICSLHPWFVPAHPAQQPDAE